MCAIVRPVASTPPELPVNKGDSGLVKKEDVQRVSRVSIAFDLLHEHFRGRWFLTGLFGCFYPA
jgi:hypothetical protein